LQLARLYAPAPASLRRKVRANLGSVAISPAASKPLLWHWLAAAAALLLFAIAGWKVNRTLRTNDYQGELAEEIVEAHMTSLHPGNITGIASNDADVVKGWFSGKARFPVPVHNFSHEGFTLQGGRMDLVEGRSIPALVYMHDGHLINVFIWPTRERDTAAREGSRQGFQWIDWRKRKIEFCAVSEIDLSDLKKFYELMDSSAS
jgi:anti-sigma factor RsiW